jgi:hypothetical protein
MTATDDLATATRQVNGLRETVAALRAGLGDTVDVQRVRDDVTRLAADLNLVARAAGLGGGGGPARSGEVVYVPDDDYDPSFWVDADDEGLGSTGRVG